MPPSNPLSKPGGGVSGGAAPGRSAPMPPVGTAGNTTSAQLFDPSKPEKDLLDSLAEKQADRLEINSAQLRRFFSELKDLYRRYESLTAGESDAQRRQAVYAEQIEPQFKMIRSKVYYAGRPGGQAKIPPAFRDFLSEGIKKVGNEKEFKLFIRHVEAVVGFMYGKEGKVIK